MGKDLDISELFGIEYSDAEINEMNPIRLAYIGDAVYELFVRYYITKEPLKAYELQKLSTKYVSAYAQKAAYEKIKDELTEDEEAIFKRARNHKSHKAPKNTDNSSYKVSTGFEALIAYLFLKKEYTRLMDLVKKCLED